MKVNLKGLSFSALLALVGAFLVAWGTKGTPQGAFESLGPFILPALLGWVSGAPFHPTVDIDGDGKPDIFPKGFDR